MSGDAIGRSVIKKISSGNVTCNELTVGQVRGLLQGVTSGDLVDELLLDDVRLVDLVLFTGIKREDLDAMLPSDLEILVDGCREANPSFFRMLAKVERLQKPA